MKYLVMVQGSAVDHEAMAGRPGPGGPTWTRQDLDAVFAHMGALNEELRASGELLDARGLTSPAATRLVTVDDGGAPVVTDGPYAETEEVVAGFWLLECASLDRVTEIAARAAACPRPPGAPEHPVVIRRVDEVGPRQD
ncbi:YciI family protein [Streptomyces sp. NPDC059247]|uniref:YciI family protein n=1 Tax=Streptomyces sp. NPDC059247 TaxID=3346790 RepID=UPI0036BAE557